MDGVTVNKCTVCGEPMPPGEQMFKYHGYSGPCPAPPLATATPAEPEPAKPLTSQWAAGRPLAEITFGQYSHDWMANAVRMLMRNDLGHELVCVGARDRIVWLAARVVELEAQLAAAAIPEGFVPLPRALTAENGAKAELMGEFHETTRGTCEDCGGDGYPDGSDIPCETCDGECSIELKVPVSWDTIKQIHRRVVALFAPERPA